MAALPYMQFYVADYLADTMHLSAEEHGAYLLLIFNYWQTGKPIPKSRLQKIARIDNDRWPAVEQTLSEFFNDNGVNWNHDRIEADLAVVAEAQKQRAAAGKASAEARKASKRQELKRQSNDRSTTVEHPSNENPTNKDKKRKDKEKRLNTNDPSLSDESRQLSKSTSPKKPTPYPEAFELVWQAYPKRPGSNPKPKAFQAWNARIKEGEEPEKILQGTIRYRQFCDQTGKAHTEFVMQAARFFGKGKEYEQDWSPPASQGPVSPGSSLDRQFTDLHYARQTFEQVRRPTHSGFNSRDYSEGLKEGVTDGEPNF